MWRWWKIATSYWIKERIQIYDVNLSRSLNVEENVTTPTIVRSGCSAVGKSDVVISSVALYNRNIHHVM